MSEVNQSIFARAPWQLNLDDWKSVLRRVWHQRSQDDVSTRAAAIAYSAMFSIPTLLIAIVSIYGALASPQDVADLVERAGSIMPNSATELLQGQLESLIEQNSGALGVGALLGLAGAIWSVSGGVNRLRDTINEVYSEEDTRPWYIKRAWAIVASIGVIAVFVAAIGLIALLPALTDWLDIGGWGRQLLLLGRWLALAGLMLGLLATLFRSGPKRSSPKLAWITVGTVTGAAAWVVMSIGFGLYVQNFGSYNETYGSLGSVIVFMLWLYLSAYLILLAGEVNAELEHQTLADSTVGGDQPFGSRQAVVADTVPRSVSDDLDVDLVGELHRAEADAQMDESQVDA